MAKKQEIIRNNADISKARNRENKNGVLAQGIAVESYQGPLPRPVDFEHFERVLPGAADRILSMAELQQKSSIEEQNKILNFQGRDVLMGSIFSFIVVIITLVMGGILIYFDKQISGFASMFTGIGVIVKILLPSRKTENNNKE